VEHCVRLPAKHAPADALLAQPDLHVSVLAYNLIPSRRLTASTIHTRIQYLEHSLYSSTFLRLSSNLSRYCLSNDF
jgi:hypothetical protein